MDRMVTYRELEGSKNLDGLGDPRTRLGNPTYSHPELAEAANQGQANIGHSEAFKQQGLASKRVHLTV